jgi:tetratricopeptide (TPR) repeat protein
MNRMILPALLLRGTLCGLALLVPATVWAQAPTDCPTEIPAASAQRRALAKDWFSRAESAEAANDPIGAVKAYQCSLRLVPHAFTAFNLGRLAERTGDLELAVESFNTYLKLSPEAQDKTDIEAKLASLNERIRSLRTEQLPIPPPGTATATPGTEPVATGPGSSSPLPDLRPADPGPRPGADATAVAEQPGEGPVITPTMWAIGGVGVAALAGGIFLNLAARSKMDRCNELAEMKPPVPVETALEQCDAAKPRAYGSYALFGVAAAAAAADVVLFVLGQQQSQESQTAARLRSVSIAPTSGGAVVGGNFRF